MWRSYLLFLVQVPPVAHSKIWKAHRRQLPGYNLDHDVRMKFLGADLISDRDQMGKIGKLHTRARISRDTRPKRAFPSLLLAESRQLAINFDQAKQITVVLSLSKTHTEDDL